MLPSPLIVAGVCSSERRIYAAGLAAATRRGLLRVAPSRGQSMQSTPSEPLPVKITHDRRDVERFVIDADIEVDVLHLDVVMRAPSAPIVCVVDARHMLDDLRNPAPLSDTAAAGDPDGDVGGRARRAVTLLEAASLICLVRWERAETAELSLLMALASHLAPRARVRLSRGPAEDLQALAGSSPHGDESTTLERSGWVHALNDEHDPYMTDPRVSTLRYERLRPFHPTRLTCALDEIDSGRHGTVMRSAGFCRLATRAGILARWDQVGSAMWIDPQDASMEASLTAQDLALTGIDLIHRTIMSTLDAALLSDAELEAGPAGWARFDDPLPEWPRVTDDSVPRDPPI